MALSEAEMEERQAKRAELARGQYEQDFRDLLSRPAGRRLLLHILEQLAGTFGASFMGGRPEDAIYREGQRSVGIALMQEAQRLEPTDYVHMLLEGLERQAEERRQRDAEQPTERDG